MSAKSDILSGLERLEREAFKKGWDAAIAHVLSAAQQSAQPSLKLEPSAKAAETSGQEPSVIDLTLRAIQSGDGLPGHQVAKMVQLAFPTDRHKAVERTVRTALARLKSRGKIENRNGMWIARKDEAA